MYNGMLHLHNFLRWVFILLLLVALYKNFAAKGGPYSPLQKRLALFLLICADLMLLVGLYQWIAGPLGLKNIQALGFKEVMGNAVYRFYAIEHTTGMLLAIFLIHLAYSYCKKDRPDRQKQRRSLLYYMMAFLIILISVPWPFREVGTGRSWFPGM